MWGFKKKYQFIAFSFCFSEDIVQNDSFTDASGSRQDLRNK